MAISWGSWESSGGNGMRVGIDATWEHISHGEGAATCTFKVYTENRYAYNDNQVLSYGGSAGSGSTSFHNGSSGAGPVLRATKTYTYNYGSGEYGSSPGSRTFSATVSGAYNGVTPSRQVTVTIPARPYGQPAAPTGVGAARVDDSATAISWTNNATAGRPYDSVAIHQRNWQGEGWSGFRRVATVSGSATSHRVTGLSPNTFYGWRLDAFNDAGRSDPSSIVKLNTTPSAPLDVRTKVSADGSSTITTWTSDAYSAPNGDGERVDRAFIVERAVVAGGGSVTWEQLATAAQSPFTDPAPYPGSNQYRVATRSETGLPLVSTWSTSNAVSTIVPPLAPTNLAPDGQPVDLWFEGATLSWRHNDGGDGVEQTRAEIEHSIDQGQTWLPLADMSTAAQTYEVPAGQIHNAQDVTWRVRTYGVASQGPGPWSTSGVILARTRPVATLTGPTSPWPSGLLTATWTYGQPSGPWGQETAAQAEWSAELVDPSGTVLQEAGAFDAATTHQFTHRLEDASTYTVTLRVRSTDGLWSEPTTITTTTDFPEPALVYTVPTWRPQSGSVSLNMAALAPGVDEDPVVAVTVERSTGDGQWVTLAENLPIPTDLIDPLPTLSGSNEYRVTSISSLPVYRVNDIVVVHTPTGAVNDGPDPGISWSRLSWVMVNAGESWSTLLKFVGDPDISVTTGRARDSHAFLGRRKPLGAWGENRTRELSVSGRLAWRGQIEAKNSSTDREWEDFGLDAGLVAFRDMHGRRVFGQMSDVGVSHEAPGLASLSFTVTELDYREEYGAPVTEGGEGLDDFHIDLISADLFTAWGLSVNDNGDGSWTATSSLITDFGNGSWSADETDNVGV